MKDKEIIELVGLAVLEKLTIPNKFHSGNFTAVDLVQANDQTLDSLYQEAQKRMAAYATKSLLQKRNDEEVALAERQADVIEGVYTWRIKRKEERELQAKVIEEAQNKLIMLTKAIGKKEQDRIKGLSNKELSKELAAVQAVLNAQ